MISMFSFSKRNRHKSHIFRDGLPSGGRKKCLKSTTKDVSNSIHCYTHSQSHVLEPVYTPRPLNTEICG